MKKLFKMLSVLLIPLIITSCGEEEVTYRTAKQIEESGSINVSVCTDQYTFLKEEETVTSKDKIYLEEKKIIDAISKALNVKVNLLKQTKEEILTAIIDGTTDMAIGKINVTESDKFKVAYSLTYAKEDAFVITNKNVILNTLADLEGKKVGVKKDSPLESLIKDNVGGMSTGVIGYKELKTAVEQLTLYSIDAVISYKEDALNLLETNKDIYQVSTLYNLSPASYVILSAKGNEGLLETINAEIEKELINKISPTVQETVEE